MIPRDITLLFVSCIHRGQAGYLSEALKIFYFIRILGIKPDLTAAPEGNSFEENVEQRSKNSSLVLLLSGS